MRPTALVLNILVAAVAVWRFRKARFFSWPALWPFLLGSVPLAWAGGSVQLSTQNYHIVMGVVLLFSSGYLAWRAFNKDQSTHEFIGAIPIFPAVAIGAGIGFLSGLTGVGGGVFLSPLLLLTGWAGPKHTAGLAAPFILLNSSAGLIGNIYSVQSVPAELPGLALAALLGAIMGTWLGLFKLSNRALLLILAVVMMLAASKLIVISFH